MTFEELQDLLAEQFSCDTGDLTRSTALEDLDADHEDMIELAKKYHYEGLSFLHGDIADYTGTDSADMVVTLHACDTATDYALEKVYNIIDSRVRANKPMIITSNLELNDMMECEDIRKKRIYDRILECCYPMYVGGKSFRMMKAAQRFDEMKDFLEE